jgi:Rps23 Pro-64 3,4-dihydroxylase Tpa1-like proline 4-hydroxylase
LVELVPLLSPADCSAFLKSARASAAWRPAPIYLTDAPLLNEAVRRAALLHEEALAHELDALCASVKARAVEVARRRCGAELDAGEIQLVRYPPGGFFYTHQDATASPKEWRKLSFVVYLNDDFEGGTTRFPELGTDVQPRAGYALIFPPHHAHAAEPVASGEKFVLTFWLGRDTR